MDIALCLRKHVPNNLAGGGDSRQENLPRLCREQVAPVLLFFLIGETLKVRLGEQTYIGMAVTINLDLSDARSAA
jgi:hypothetical protein